MMKAQTQLLPQTDARTGSQRSEHLQQVCVDATVPDWRAPWDSQACQPEEAHPDVGTPAGLKLALRYLVTADKYPTLEYRFRCGYCCYGRSCCNSRGCCNIWGWCGGGGCYCGGCDDQEGMDHWDNRTSCKYNKTCQREPSLRLAVSWASREGDVWWRIMTYKCAFWVDSCSGIAVPE